MCHSPEPGEVGTDRAQEEEKHTGKAVDGSREESAELAPVCRPCAQCWVWESSRGMDSRRRDGNLDCYIIVIIIT